MNCVCAVLLSLLLFSEDVLADITERPTAALPTPSSEISRQSAASAERALITQLAAKDLFFGAPVFIRIFKESLELEVWMRRDDVFIFFKSYMICDLSGNLGPKQQEGDRQGPEGFYAIGIEQMNPFSRFHLSMDIGYPNLFDQQLNRSGNRLMIHGGCLSNGCFAMADFRIDEIYTLVDAALADGQQAVPVHIFPFRFSEENIAHHQHSSWFSFWMNLKEGDDFFLQNHIPPVVHADKDGYSYSWPSPAAD